MRRNIAAISLKISCKNLFSVKTFDETNINLFALSLLEKVSWGLTYFDEFISTGDAYSTSLTQESGWISAPDENNDGHYDNGLYCYWHVKGQKGEKIKFEIVYSRLEDSPGCGLDFLTVKSRNIDKCFVFFVKLCAILKFQSFPNAGRSVKIATCSSLLDSLNLAGFVFMVMTPNGCSIFKLRSD